MIPKSQEAIRDMVVAGAFIAISAIVPTPSIAANFAAHLSGVSLGIGLGWLVKSIIDHIAGVRSEK